MTASYNLSLLGSNYNQGGTGAVARTTASKLQESVSVKDFGAVGDGTTDDTAAFTAATAASSNGVFVPPASYKITGTVTGLFYTTGLVTIVTGTVNAIAVRTFGASHSDGTDTIVGSPRQFIGNNAPSSDDSALLIGRGLSGSYNLGAHAVRDESTYTSPSGTGFFGYSSFDSIPTVGGSVHWNHAHSYQARLNYSGSNTVDELAGFTHQVTHSGAGTATLSYGFRAGNALGTGPITTQTAFFVDGVFNRGAANYALYSGSVTVSSYHGGVFQFGTAPQVSGWTTYGAIVGHDASGNLLDNPNLTIVNGVLTMANATTSKVVSSVAANLQLDAQVVVQSLKPHLFPVYTVATLPSPASAYTYCRAFVSDSNATLTAGIGAIVAAGGANKVPIYCDGTNWRIG